MKSPSSASADGDELPPRENGPTPLPTTPTSSRTNTPGPATPNGEISEARLNELDADELSPGIPRHAGFDFKAIKEVIGTADQNPKELQIPSPNRFVIPPAAPPTHRTGSAPPLAPESPTPARTSSALKSLSLSSSPKTVPVAGPSTPRRDLTSSSSHSNLLKSVREDPEIMTSSHHPQTATFESPRPPHSRAATTDDSLWGAEPESNSSYPLDDFSSLSGSSLRPSTRSSMYGFGSNAITNPYGSFGHSGSHDMAFSEESSSLSFGGADGTITTTPSSRVERDPWDINLPSLSSSGFPKKSASTLNLNPWQ